MITFWAVRIECGEWFVNYILRKLNFISMFVLILTLLANTF